MTSDRDREDAFLTIRAAIARLDAAIDHYARIGIRFSYADATALHAEVDAQAVLIEEVFVIHAPDHPGIEEGDA